MEGGRIKKLTRAANRNQADTMAVGATVQPACRQTHALGGLYHVEQFRPLHRDEVDTCLVSSGLGGGDGGKEGGLVSNGLGVGGRREVWLAMAGGRREV